MKLARLFRGTDRGAITLRLVVSSALVAASAGAGLIGSGVAFAAKPGTITICHATSATANPYVVQNPDNTADVSGHGGHTGLVYAAGMLSGWGDIIPPFTANDGTPYPGLNWDAAGQAIYNNNCNLPGVVDQLPNAVNDAYTATEGDAATTLLVLSNDSLGDTPTEVVSVTAATAGTAAVTAGGGSVTYTAPAVGTGAATAAFDYVIEDDDGDQSTGTVTVTLDRKPLAAADAYTLTQGDGATTLAVRSNDALGDVPTTIVSTTNPALGSVSIAADGLTVSYTPPTPGVAGTSDSFTYTIQDTQGDPSTATVTVTLDPADLQPVAADDSYSVTAGGGQLTMPVLTNDTMGNGASTITSHTAPAGVALSGSSFTYTPPAAGAPASTITFTYTIWDADGDASTATVTINVAPAPVPPPPAPVPAPVPVPDLAVKVTGPASVEAGTPITWILTVTNKASAGQSGFTVTSVVSDGVSISALSGTGFDCTLATLACVHGGLLGAGSTAVVTVSGTVADGSEDDVAAFRRLANAVVPATVTNTAIVTPTDVTPLDNVDSLVTSVTQPVGPADLVLAKAAPANAVQPGDAVTWTITVTNAGASPAGGFTVSDPLAAGLSFVSASGDGFSCQRGTTIVCTYGGSLAPGATATVLLTTALDAGYTATSVSNTATAELTDDPTPANNADEAVVGVNLPIGGGIEQPGTGPSPTPHASPSPLPSTLPFADEEDEEEQPRALPFTGGSTDLLLGLGAGLSVIGLLLALTGRRRRLVE